jgi:hypothetical protein
MQEVKKLIESRQIEALKKHIPAKLMTIVKYMGQKIYNHSDFGSGIERTELPSFDEFEEEEIPEMDGSNYDSIGYVYDSLSSGRNFEIRYLQYENELVAKFNGNNVFLEVDGKIKGYVPNETWESWMDKLYEIAKPIETKTIKDEKEEKKKSLYKHAIEFIEELKQVWGI